VILADAPNSNPVEAANTLLGTISPSAVASASTDPLITTGIGPIMNETGVMSYSNSSFLALNDFPLVAKSAANADLSGLVGSVGPSPPSSATSVPLADTVMFK